MHGFRMNNCIRASDTKSSTGVFHSPDVHVPADGEGEAAEDAAELHLACVRAVRSGSALSFFL